MSFGFKHRPKAMILGILTPAFLVVSWGVWEFTQPRPQQRFSVPVIVDGKEQSIQLELFEPVTHSSGNHPAILLFHGVEGPHNFWRQRYQTAATLRRQGYSVFIVHYMNGRGYDDLYRFDGNGKLDIAAIDAQRIEDDERWIHTVNQVLEQIAKRSEIDPDRIALYGNSMGGFLSLAVAADVVSQDAPIKPCCVVVNWGALWKETRIPRNFPPTLFVHGEFDTIVEPRWAHYSVDKIREAGGQANVVIVLGAGHIAQSLASDEAILNFLAEHLR